ncbi:methyl-accepting chemotaxis protein [Cognatiyoonia sp. IB215182]|uniref:methyl-accepting chemotaxis protein n=1 Tax=Cognatiyoonia sp. IB215182 TaxID=3097353 RepID=UPI002A160DD1|nr:methyl-accepting chemotaxis protein [Cognatiyoonia sp. IB215182]MDX8355195.1 methyl-accepting chemotaxis protein [Cognatiyoonia sp. IB215182]
MTSKNRISSDERAVLAMIIGMVPLVGLITFIVGAKVALELAVTGSIAGFALAAAAYGAKALKPLLGVALVGQCVALTAAFSGHPWQIDSHMAFFAVLAVLVVLRDIPTILVATAAIALHHLSLSIMLPTLVYPSADVAANLMRTLYHAVIILVEAGFLCIAVHRQNHLVAKVEAQMADTAQAVEAERAATAEREAAHARQRVAVSTLSSGLEALAKGDLTIRLGADIDGEFATLQRNFNTSLDQLQSILKGVVSTADDISSGSNNLASAANRLAERTEQQAASLGETAATIARIKGSVDETAENADNANTLMLAARELADDGKEVVSETVSAMDQIDKVSNEISQIISTIDDIAFQTNLLALNAGVEAARAGSAGQGFAVVAAEVRALAQRAGEASKEIAMLIRKSDEKVRSGVELAEKANGALASISDQVSKVSEAVAAINDATKTQAVGVSEIDAAMKDLDNLTQHNAAMVEETTAASVELNSDAAGLKQSASILRIDGHQGPREMALAS